MRPDLLAALLHDKTGHWDVSVIRLHHCCEGCRGPLGEDLLAVSIVRISKSNLYLP